MEEYMKENPDMVLEMTLVDFDLYRKKPIYAYVQLLYGKIYVARVSMN